MKGKQEKFAIRLLLDRVQRKALDLLMENVRMAVDWVAIDHKNSVWDRAVRSEEEIARLVSKEREYSMDMAMGVVRLGRTRASKQLLGEISDKSGRPISLIPVPVSDLVFAVYDQTVKLPYIGVAKFVVNKKILEWVGSFQLRKEVFSIQIGYKNNDPALIVDTVDREKKDIPIPNQKLVKLKRKPRQGS